ncbi:MAG: hypothetical protein ACJAVK_003455 [Akkermansiaceae bacterium]|jgi:hypothetical protein
MRYLLIFFLTWNLSAVPVFDLKIGSPFPGYALENIANGERKSVRAYFEQKTILHIFASW